MRMYELLSGCLQQSLVGVTNVETKPVHSGMNIPAPFLSFGGRSPGP